jgi:hypothetical protein
MCRYNRCHDNAVIGFWALWVNTYERVIVTVAMVVLLMGFAPYGLILTNVLL